MSTSRSSTQPDVERRSAEAELAGMIARHAPAHETLVASMRKALRKRMPTAHEIVYEYGDFFVISWSPDDRGYEGVVGIRASAKGVELWFNRGNELPDPEKVLKGSGRQTRSMAVDAASTLARPAVTRLIDGAIERCPVAFASTGRGPVTIRETSAKRRQAAPAKTAGKNARAKKAAKPTTAKKTATKKTAAKKTAAKKASKKAKPGRRA